MLIPVWWRNATVAWFPIGLAKKEKQFAPLGAGIVLFHVLITEVKRVSPAEVCVPSGAMP